MANMNEYQLKFSPPFLEKIAGKVSIGPILDQIRSNIGPNQGQHWTKKAHVWVKSYKYEWMFIHIG